MEIPGKEKELNELLEDALNDLLDEGSPVEPNAGGSGLGQSKEKNVPDEEEMNKFFENMAAQLKAELPKIDPKEAQAKINEQVPEIFDMMQNLLSRELLYPALKDLAPKFDEWLKKNEATLTKKERKRYKGQRDIIKDIINNFDDESLDAGQRFEENLNLMEKMQSLGSPPEELTVQGGGMGKCPII